MPRRRNALYLIVAISLLAALVTGRTFFFNVAYAFIGLLIFALLWAWGNANWLRLMRQTRARRAQVGRYLEERFAVRNGSVVPKLWLEIYDSSTLPGHQASHVVSLLGPKAEKSWTVRTLCVQRGEFVLGSLRVVTGDPFGLFQNERHINATSRLVVYPLTVHIAEFVLPVGLLPGGEALRQRTHQVTANASGVRDYAPGDSFNRIHWRSTARHNRLIVKEFELDPLADIWIMMDAERTVQAGIHSLTDAEIECLSGQKPAVYTVPPTTEEYAVTIAASLAQHFLAKERSVGFASHGQRHEIIQVDQGARQLTKILETLALIQAIGTMPFGHLLSLEGDNLSRGTTVIAITPSAREEWIVQAHRLIRRGLRVVVVLIDAGSFGGRPGAQQAAAQLTLAGIPAYVVHKGDDLQVALAQTSIR
jgi:uncharacterized protein (DUF58 family)